MGLRQRIVSEIYDEKDSRIVDRQIIKDKEIKKPEKIDDLGYNHEEQIAMLQSIQDMFLNEQRNSLVPEKCTVCGSSKISKSGSVPSDFHAVYTDHRLMIPRIRCCNKDCSTGNINMSIYSLFGSNMHPDLVKKQVEVASETSFMNAQKYFEKDNGRYRSINNQLTIKKTTDKVGSILSELHQEVLDKDIAVPVESLIVQVDGGYIKSLGKNSNGFETLVSSIYKPENHICGGISKNGIKKSGKIIDKIYSASAVKDRGKTIKAMTIAAAKKHGMSKDTKITGLSDGASNCWNIIKSLEKQCNSIDYILDWYHIKVKLDRLINQLDDPYSGEIESIKWKIWHGKSKEAIERLSSLYMSLLNGEYADKLHDLLKYLSNNIEYLVNYEERKASKLPYTSSIIESTIETLVNTRHKKKHKALWSREGAHNVLQIRSSIASNKWKNEWNDTKEKFYIPKSKAA